MSDKYNNAPPPSYPAPVHQDASPYPPSQSPAPYVQGQAPAANDYYQQHPYQSQGGYYPPQQGYPQPGYPQQGMYYGGQGPPPQGYYVQQDRGRGTGTGICAGIFGALAVCCCLDMIF